MYSWAGALSTWSVRPCSTMAPWRITTTRSDICETTARSCEINSMATPSRSRKSLSSSRIDACTDTSSAEVASSHTSTEGSSASVRAMPTRCFSPPLSWCG
ncbi:Protein of uncharacterised function (DUF1602) [Bordetella pertussis]|nr:Protein of uncharacterised function (DUF1602) [Bordetella pertussis]